MGQGGEWSSETRFGEMWPLQETESLGGGFEDQEHFAMVFPQQTGAITCVMFMGESAKGKNR